MRNIGYSDNPRVRIFAGYIGSLLLFAGLGTLVGFGVPTQDDRAARPDEDDRPFAQIAGDDQHSPVWSLAFSADDTFLASATISGDVSLKNLKFGQRNLIQQGLMGSAHSLAFSADGRALAVAGLGPVVRLWDVASGEELEPMPFIAENEATRVAFSWDGKHVATCGLSGITTIWEWSSRRQLIELGGPVGCVKGLTFSPDGSLLAAGASSAGVLKLWDIVVGEERSRVSAVEPGHGVTALAVSTDGSRLATASYPGGSVQIWNVADGGLRTALPSTALGVRALAFSPDGALLALAGEDGTAMLWGIAEARVLGSARANDRGLQSIAFSNDGRLMATGGTDGFVRLWDLAQVLGSRSRRFTELATALK